MRKLCVCPDIKLSALDNTGDTLVNIVWDILLINARDNKRTLVGNVCETLLKNVGDTLTDNVNEALVSNVRDT